MVGVQLMLERVVGMASQLSQGYSTVKVAPMFKPAAPLQGIGRASHILSHWPSVALPCKWLRLPWPRCLALAAM